MVKWRLALWDNIDVWPWIDGQEQWEQMVVFVCVWWWHNDEPCEYLPMNSSRILYNVKRMMLMSEKKTYRKIRYPIFFRKHINYQVRYSDSQNPQLNILLFYSTSKIQIFRLCIFRKSRESRKNRWFRFPVLKNLVTTFSVRSILILVDLYWKLGF